MQADWDKTDEPEKTQGDEDEEGEDAEKKEQAEDNGNTGPKEYNDEELEKRIGDLTESVTLTSWE